MGLGKTVMILSVFCKWLREGRAKKILVIAPKRVAENTWPEERNKWEHTKDLKMSVVSSYGKGRGESKRLAALGVPAHVYVIGVDNLPWLVGVFGNTWPFDTVVVDELSMFKNNDSLRFRAIKVVLSYTKNIVGLTGTPMPNGLLDLWSQLYILDMGERLGKTVGAYRNEFFKPGRQLASNAYEYDLKTKDGIGAVFGPRIYELSIYSKIADICISMSAKDHLPGLPDRTDQDVSVILKPEDMQRYKDFQRLSVLELFGEGQDITAVNAAVLRNKLLEFANGAVYTNAKRMEYEEIHNNKIEALGEFLAAANGQPVLVSYNFRHDMTRIKKHLGKHFKIHDVYEKDFLTRWNAKQTPVLLGHPKSMSHGLNMQDGGRLLCSFGLNWSSELYRQLIARIHRQGQLYNTLNARLVGRGTVDEIVCDRLDGKIEREDGFLAFIKAIVKETLNG
jgi:SNF2 family DNA or RNA helicase